MASFTACVQRRDLYLAMATGHMAGCNVSSYRLFKVKFLKSYSLADCQHVGLATMRCMRSDCSMLMYFSNRFTLNQVGQIDVCLTHKYAIEHM